MEGVLVIKNLPVKLFNFFNGGCIGNKNVSAKFYSFFNGGSIGDEELVCQPLQFLQWRQFWWSRTCLSNSSASSMEGVLVKKNVSVKLFSFFNGRSIGDQNVSAKFYSFFNGGSIGDEGLVCQTLQFLQWRQYWWSRTCLSNSSASSMEGVLLIKNVSLKLVSIINGGSIGEEGRVCQTLQLHQWREYWWSRIYLSNSSASSMEGVLVIKIAIVKLFNFFNGGSIGNQKVSAKFYSFFNGGSFVDEELVCQTLQFLQWRQYWWSRTCLSNSSPSSMEGVLVMKNVSVKLFSFINGGSIGDQERVCQTLQLLQWKEYWWPKRVCQILQLIQRREYWWRRTCLSNSSVSSVEAVLVIKNVSVILFSFFKGGRIGDQERVCQIVQLLQWREYWLSRTCLPNSSAYLVEGILVIKTLVSNSSPSSMEVVLVMMNVSVKLFSFINGGSIGDEERVCQTLQLHKRRVYWWSRICLPNSLAP